MDITTNHKVKRKNFFTSDYLSKKVFMASIYINFSKVVGNLLRIILGICFSISSIYFALNVNILLVVAIAKKSFNESKYFKWNYFIESNIKSLLDFSEISMLIYWEIFLFTIASFKNAESI